jgi:hypothetical protein
MQEGPGSSRSIPGRSSSENTASPAVFPISARDAEGQTCEDEMDVSAGNVRSERLRADITKVTNLNSEYLQARPYIEYYYPDLASALYENGMWQYMGVPQDKETKRLWAETQKKREYILRDLKACPSHRELLQHFALVDKITGEIHDIKV